MQWKGRMELVILIFLVMLVMLGILYTIIVSIGF